MHMHERMYLYRFMRLSSRSINGFLFCFLTPCGIVPLRIALWWWLIGPWSPSATPCSPGAFRNYLTLLWLNFFSDPSQSLLSFFFFFLSPAYFPHLCVHGAGVGVHVYHNLGVESEDILGTICWFQVWNLGPQTDWQALLLPEPSHRPCASFSFQPMGLCFPTIFPSLLLFLLLLLYSSWDHVQSGPIS